MPAEDAASAPAEPPVARIPVWRRALPVVLAGALIALVLTRLDLAAFRAALGRTNLPLYLACALGFSIVLLCADCLASTVVYRRLVGPIRIRDLIVLRGASYLPGMLNHNVGTAWLAYAVAKTCKAPLLRVAGATLLVYATTLFWVVLLAAASIAIAPGRFAWLPAVLLVIAAGAVAYALVLALRPQWLARYRVTAPLAEAGLAGHVVTAVARAPHVAVVFLGSWLSFRFFAVDIPLGDALALVPPLMVLVSLPITPQGVGTRDAFAIAVFAGYASGTEAERVAAVAASTLSWAISLTLVQVSISLVLLPAATRRMRAPEPPRAS
jgi:hypothetical protein